MRNETTEKPIETPPDTTDGEKWHIAWRSRTSGEEGRFVDEYHTKEECQVDCDCFNRNKPHAHHWPQSV